MISRKKYNITVALLVLIALLSYGCGKFSALRSSKLLSLEKAIEKNFALDYDKEAAETAAAKAYTESLNDPYSEYFTKAEYDTFTDILNYSYKGIGVTIDFTSDRAVISEVTKLSPADEAGVAVGDILMKVDDYTLTHENYDEVIYYIKGASLDSVPDDTPMRFTFDRGGVIYETEIKRSSITLPCVESEMLDNGIYYIKLSEFSTTAKDEFSEALKGTKDAEAIILDLRNNGGGLVESLMEVAGEIMPKGLLFSSEDASGKKREYRIKDNDYNSLPIAVLVNENTASASEILSSAIQESGRGILIGKTTYGKGLVQTAVIFPDGSAAKITCAKYYTLDGSYINGVGINPDITVEDEEGRDAQLEAAVNYLSGQ